MASKSKPSREKKMGFRDDELFLSIVLINLLIILSTLLPGGLSVFRPRDPDNEVATLNKSSAKKSPNMLRRSRYASDATRTIGAILKLSG